MRNYPSIRFCIHKYLLSQRLKIIRSASVLSLRDLGERIDKLVTAQAISNYERGKSTPDSTVLLALADALGGSGTVPDRQSTIHGPSGRARPRSRRSGQTYRPLVHRPACLKHIGGSVHKGSISLLLKTPTPPPKSPFGWVNIGRR